MKDFVDRIARRYARAMIEAAKERHLEARVAGDLNTLDQIVRDLPDVSVVLRNPAISRDEREKIAGEIAKRAGFSTLTTNLLKLLVKNDRVQWIHEITVGYQEELDKVTRTVRSTIYTAKPLPTHLRFRIQKILASHLGAKRIVLDTEVDPEVLGGFRIEVGDRVYDMSVAGYLDRLRRHLVGEG